MSRLFLYLASRKKEGIKLVAVMAGEPTVSTRLTDLQRLHLPHAWEVQIAKIIDDNKMHYEPWLESAESYNDLRDRLRARGYTQLAMGAVPMLNLGANPPKANTSSCHVQKTMTRRKW